MFGNQYNYIHTMLKKTNAKNVPLKKKLVYVHINLVKMDLISDFIKINSFLIR